MPKPLKFIGGGCGGNRPGPKPLIGIQPGGHCLGATGLPHCD